MTPSERVAFKQLQQERFAKGEITKKELDESLVNREKQDAYEELLTLKQRVLDYSLARGGELSGPEVDTELAEAAYRAAFHAYVDKYINKRS